MKQNIYYKTNATTVNGTPRLISYSFRTKKTIIYKTKNEFGIADNLTFEGCEKSVENNFWSRISYKEFLDLLNSLEKPYNTDFSTKIHKAIEEEKRKANLSDSKYFVRTDCSTSLYYKFLECRPDTSVIAHISKTEIYTSAYTSDIIMTNKCWKEITKTEAFKLFDEMPVVNVKTPIPAEPVIVYYNHKNGFKNNDQFVSVNKTTGIVTVYSRECKEGFITPDFTDKYCEELVAKGEWVYITKEEAFKLIADVKVTVAPPKSYPTTTLSLKLPKIQFFILAKEGNLGPLFFKFVDTKNWSWTSSFDESTKFSSAFLNSDRYNEIVNNLFTPLWNKDKQKLYWILMDANPTQTITFSA